MSVKIPSSGRVVSKSMKISTSPAPMGAVGGSVADVTIDEVTFRVHTFTATGILTVTTAGTAEYLVLAGGGGGNPSPRGGAGGAGGLRTGNISLGVTSYTINVGAGGAAASQGEDSFIGNSPTGPYILNSTGGGSGGGTQHNNPGSVGGAGGSGGGGGTGGHRSSGGSGGPGIPGQGHPGGVGYTEHIRGGGGGGAGGAGVPGVSGAGAGAGAYVSITGGPVYYAHGGTGSGLQPGASNTGAGGDSSGSSGGSGIVVIRYRI